MKWLATLLEPKNRIDEQRQIFSNAFLRKLILPLLLEGIFAILIGYVDSWTMITSSDTAYAVLPAGSLNNGFVAIFTALATGGAILISQYLGSKDREQGNMAASQIAMTALMLSILCMICMLLAINYMPGIVFRRIDEDMIESAKAYLRVSTYSYPLIALYSVGAAIQRSMGKSSVTLRIAIGMNVVNAIGNALSLRVFHTGAEGIAWSTFLSWLLGAATIIALSSRRNNEVRLRWQQFDTWDGGTQRRILRIALPVVIGNILAILYSNNISNRYSVDLTVVTTMFRNSTQIGALMAPAFIAVIGRCIGAGDTGAAEYYLRKLTRITIAAAVAWNVLTMLLRLPVTIELSRYLVHAGSHSATLLSIIALSFVCGVLSSVPASLFNGLLAAGDVKFTMLTSLIANVVYHVALSIYLIFRPVLLLLLT